MTTWFEWDAEKAASNQRKHGVSFDAALLVFGDAFAITEQDRIEGGEQRWRTLGMSGDVLLLLVAHTVKDLEDEDEVVRIISAREATAAERRQYRAEWLVRTRFDPQNPPRMTPEIRAELEALKGRPIDTSDIPELDEGFWERAVPNPFYKPNKTQLTVRLDSDVLTWLKAGGKGYQSKLNAILRQAMLRDAPKR